MVAVSAPTREPESIQLSDVADLHLTLVGGKAPVAIKPFNLDAFLAKFLHGETVSGNKVHMGFDLDSAVRRGRHQVAIHAVCMVDLVIEDPRRGFPRGRASDLCKNCFRKVFRNAIIEFDRLAEQGMDPATRLDTLVKEAVDNDWTRDQLIQEITTYRDFMVQFQARVFELFPAMSQDRLEQYFGPGIAAQLSQSA